MLLRLLMMTFAPEGELIVGIDDTIERRRGDKIKAKAIYRDPVRSAHSHFVELIARWVPDRDVVFVDDSRFAALDLLYLVSGAPNIDLITRLHLDTQLYDPAPERKAEIVRPRVKGVRRPSP